MWRKNQEWQYKGHKCKITADYEDDCVKAWHDVVLPNGEKKFADITPYDWDPSTVELWIDAGYPSRISIGPLHREDLEGMIKNEMDS